MAIDAAIPMASNGEFLGHCSDHHPHLSAADRLVQHLSNTLDVSRDAVGLTRILLADFLGLIEVQDSFALESLTILETIRMLVVRSQNWADVLTCLPLMLP